MYIITGAAGFIGSNLLASLRQAGCCDLVVCDLFGTQQKWRNLRHHHLDDWVHPDHLLDYLQQHQDRIDAVVHLGAISSTVEADTDLILKNNFILSRDIFQWATAAQKRFIYASSAATYGDGTLGFKDDESLTYLQKLKPLNPYGWSKHLFDLFVMTQKKHGNPLPKQYAGLKFFNVYGPNEYHKIGQMSVAWQLYQQAILPAATLELFKSYHSDYADGAQLRDFIWVQDCVDVMLWLLETPSVNGLFNVGSGRARSFLDLAKAVQKNISHDTHLVFKEMPESLRDKYQYYTEAEMTKLKTAGYTKPFTSLEEGVDLYIQQYLSQKEPYR